MSDQTSTQPARPVTRGTERARLESPESVAFAELPEKVSMSPVSKGPDHAYELTISNDEAGVYAVWEAAPGVYPRVKNRAGSAMYILSGDAIVYDADGEAHEMHEGTTVVLPYRWEGRWEILRQCRKVFAYTWPQREPQTVPAKAKTLNGVEARHGDLEEALPASRHLAPLPDVRARIVHEDVDGICAVVALEPGQTAIADSARAAHLFVIEGDAEVVGANGEAQALREGSAFTLPIGWRGTWSVEAPVRLFAVFTAPQAEGVQP